MYIDSRWHYIPFKGALIESLQALMASIEPNPGLGLPVRFQAAASHGQLGSRTNLDPGRPGASKKALRGLGSK